MPRLLPSLALAAALLALPACTVAAPPTQPTPSAQPAGPSGTMLVGRVFAPSNVIAPGGANVVAAGSGNVIAPGGGNVVAAGSANMQGRGLLAVTEKPLADAEVYIADAAGKPLPAFPPVKTDAEGRYAFPKVPAGHTFVVAARCKTAGGKDATLQGLARTSEFGTTADISAGSTLVTVGVAEGQGALAEFNVANYQSAVEAANKNLKDDQLPDWSERKAIKAQLETMAAEIAELKTAVEAMRKDLAEIKGQLADIKKQLAEALAKNNGGAPVGQPATTPGDAPTQPVVNQPSTGDPCTDLLRALDADRDGALTMVEFRGILTLQGAPSGDAQMAAQMDAGFRMVDFNGDGLLDRDELCYLVAAGSQASGDASGDTSGDYDEGDDAEDPYYGGATGSDDDVSSEDEAPAEDDEPLGEDDEELM